MCACSKCQTREANPDVRPDLLPSHGDGLVSYRSVGASVHVAIIGKVAKPNTPATPSTPLQASI